jgi:hypothetical protein
MKVKICTTTEQRPDANVPNPGSRGHRFALRFVDRALTPDTAQWRKACSTVESICADLGITIAQCHEPTGPLRTKAGQTLRRMILDHGEGHVIITLRTIVESSGNERALTASGIQGVSDIILAHPSWSDHGLAWIEAFDNIDLIDLAKKAEANRAAVPKRQAMAAMLYERLAPIFDPPPKTRKHRQFKHTRTTPRYAHLPAT